MLNVENVSFRYQDNDILNGINFSVSKGEIFGILGPNGSGKTTLLKVISRSMQPSKGQVLINSKPINQYLSKEIATLLAVLPQSIDISFSFTVEETIRMGRYAHQKGFFPRFTLEDDRILDEAMEQTNLKGLHNKTLDMLSGGERQRVFLARALVQEPKLLMLDEPTNHLDLSHQIKLLDSLKRWSSEKQLTVVAIFHDLNLASLYCDRVLLLDQGTVIDVAQPHDALNEKVLKEIYHTSLLRHEHPTIPKPLITLLPNEKSSINAKQGDFIQVSKQNDVMIIETHTPFKTLSTDLSTGGFGWLSKHLIHCAQGKGIAECIFRIGIMEVYLLVSLETQNTTSGITIHLFIDAILTETAFIRLLMVITEAKTKAYCEALSNSLIIESATQVVENQATIAASQQNGTINQSSLILLEKRISKNVYELTKTILHSN